MKRCLMPKFEDQFDVNFLKNFKITPDILDIQKEVGQGRNLVIFLASSGVGRDTVLDNCLKLIKNSERIKRVTNRKIRVSKIERKRMIFLKKEDFLDKFKKGEIIMAGYYRANKKLYGVLKKEFFKLKNKNKTYFFECTILSLPLKKLFPKSKLIFLLPPSMKELKKRLLTRGDKDWQKRFKVSCSEIKVALANIKKLSKIGFIDLAILNKDSSQTAQEIVKFLRSKKYANQLWRRFFKQIRDYEI